MLEISVPLRYMWTALAVWPWNEAYPVTYSEMIVVPVADPAGHGWVT